MSEYKTLQENQSLNLEYQRNKELRELKDQLQQKENIIKEVRKYIDKQDNMNYKFREDLREITSKGE